MPSTKPRSRSIPTRTAPTRTSRTAKPNHPKSSQPKPPFPRQHQAAPGLESELKPLPNWRGHNYRSAGKLLGKVALITGGDSGIGRSVAYHYAREGADVVISCLPVERSDALEVKAAIESESRRCLIIEGDLADSRFCSKLITKSLAAFGRLDILVHNAASQSRKDVTDLTDKDLDKTMKVNVYACLRLCREAVPHMKPGSCIIVTGSIVGLQGSEQLPDYGATKGALHAITKCLAHDLLDKGIRVNCVAPGPVWTPLNPADKGMTPKDVANFGKSKGKTEMGRPAQPEELAPAYVFLASHADSSYITGIVLPVTGEPA